MIYALYLHANKLLVQKHLPRKLSHQENAVALCYRKEFPYQSMEEEKKTKNQQAALHDSASSGKPTSRGAAPTAVLRAVPLGQYQGRIVARPLEVVRHEVTFSGARLRAGCPMKQIYRLPASRYYGLFPMIPFCVVTRLGEYHVTPYPSFLFYFLLHALKSHLRPSNSGNTLVPAFIIFTRKPLGPFSINAVPNVFQNIQMYISALHTSTRTLAERETYSGSQVLVETRNIFNPVDYLLAGV